LLLALMFGGAEGAATQADEVLTVDEAVARAQANAPRAQAATHRVAAARGALLQATRLPNPALELREENLTFSDDSDNGSEPSLDFFATLSQLVEVGGKRGARRGVATAEVQVADAGLAQVRQSLAVDTMRRYVAAVRARNLGLVLTDAQAGLQGVVSTMERRVAQGYAAEADLMKFRAESARLGVQVARAQLEFDRQAAALAALIGDAAPPAPAQLVDPPQLAAPAGDPTELVQHAVERRPEVRAAGAQLERAKQALALEEARRLPDPELTAGYKRTQSTNTLVTGVVVPLPLFNTNAGNIARAAAEERAAAADVEVLRRELSAELSALLLAAHELSRRARRIGQDVLRPAEVVWTAARSAFREGGADILQLVDAERVYTEARRDALDLRLEAFAAAYEAHLYLAAEAAP
jgi:cobalt-zinc-cadmium efflux system outer membrane protein